MTTASPRKTVETTLETINKRTPAYGELSEKFGSLFLASAQLREEFIDKDLAAPPVDANRLASGVPVLTDCDLSLWGDELTHSAVSLFPELCTVFQWEKDDKRSLFDFFQDKKTILGLVRARIEGDRKHFENTSVKINTLSPGALMYISEMISAPVLGAVSVILDEFLSSAAWEQGYCPVCGSFPSISHLSPKEVTDLDQLVGGGGKKYLHCSLCGHDWRFKRNVCPACGNDDNESREVFSVDGTQRERVEACHKCGKYCLNVDMREFEPHPNLDTVQIGLIHLDMFAQNNGLSPLVPTLWNTLE